MGGSLSVDHSQRHPQGRYMGTEALNSLMYSTYFSGSKTRCDDGSAPPPPPLPPGSSDSGSPAPPPPPPAGGDDDSIAAAAGAATAYMNPGPYEQAASDGKRLVTLDTFDGFRCDINKQVSPYMAVVHSFWLGTNMIPDGRKSTYSFLTQVADDQGLLMARVDPGRGSVDGRIHRAILGGLAMGKLQVNVSTEGQGDQMLGEVDFGGMSWTGNLKYGSMGGGLVYGCNYFQAITPKLSMGGEGMYISANQNLLSNYTLKYTIPAKTGEEDSPVQAAAKAPPGMPMSESTGSSTMCLNYNSGQTALSMNYKRVVTPNRVTLGAELQCSPFTLDSQVLLGAEFRLQRSKFAVCIDGTGRMQSTLEAKLGMAPGSPSLNFAADVDHIKEEMKFGYGMTIDG
jgi:mitochondrial import receptor subunit TOM40